MVTARHEEQLSDIEAHLRRSIKRINEARFRLSPQNGAGVVAFVHIPKTAGGTVTAMFAAAYSKSGLHKAGNYMRGPEKCAQKLTKRDGAWEGWHRRGGVVSIGHVPYALFLRHLPGDTRFMTFLREPVDRVVSHYYRHIARDPARIGRVKDQPGARAKADSLEQALVEMRLPQVNNLATRFLCDDPTPAVLPDSALDEAKANLDRFMFIGIQERFDESVTRLQDRLGISVPRPKYEDRHVNTDRPAVDDLSDGDRELIVEHNRFDIELYEHGLRLAGQP
jgi:Sulfotransferase family